MQFGFVINAIFFCTLYFYCDLLTVDGLFDSLWVDYTPGKYVYSESFLFYYYSFNKQVFAYFEGELRMLFMHSV